jgi:AcrR family transcriptional regulator
MDNPSRSERSRNAAIQAALAIIARDGPGKLTFEALSRESGISKGGLMHQFRSKDEILKALLAYQTEYFDKFSRDYLATLGEGHTEPTLSAHIATSREAAAQPNSVALAIFAALVENPELLSGSRDAVAQSLECIKAEAADPDLAVLRWQAAQGLVLSTLLGMSPLSGEERERLFDCLLDESRWTPNAAAKKPAAAGTARGGKAGKPAKPAKR